MQLDGDLPLKFAITQKNFDNTGLDQGKKMHDKVMSHQKFSLTTAVLSHDSRILIYFGLIKDSKDYSENFTSKQSCFPPKQDSSGHMGGVGE